MAGPLAQRPSPGYGQQPFEPFQQPSGALPANGQPEFGVAPAPGAWPRILNRYALDGWTRLSGAVVVALALVGIADIYSVYARLERSALASRILNFDIGGFSYAQADADDHRVRLSLVVLLLASLLTAGLFIPWMYKGVQALRTRGPGSFRHDPGWAIGGWFVPVLNLVRPKLMIDDAWRSGAPGRGSKQVPWFVHLWWATFLLSGVVRFWSDKIHTSGDLGSLRTADQVDALGDGINLIAVVLAILLVQRLTRRTVEHVAR